MAERVIGSGSGDGSGDGSGSGYGYGYGSGYGSGSGSGSGYGSGSGSGSGDGSGDGDGSGSDLGGIGHHRVIATTDGAPWGLLRVGCQVGTVAWWLDHWLEVAERHDVEVTQAEVEAILALAERRPEERR